MPDRIENIQGLGSLDQPDIEPIAGTAHTAGHLSGNNPDHACTV
nr:hypothetical protein [Candidatus Sigynarchaeum springense]